MSKKLISINVNVNDRINCQSVTYSISTLLKYILYQRQQIPMQFDLLQNYIEREMKKLSNDKEDIFQLESSEISPLTARKKHMEHIQRKKLKWKKHKSTEKFLKKGSQFLSNFDSFIKEFEKKVASNFNKLEAVRIAIGTNFANAKEIYTVNILGDIDNCGFEEPLSNGSKNLINYAFFRSFLGDDAVSNLVSKNCSLQPIWLLMKIGAGEESFNQTPEVSAVPFSSPSERLIENAWIHRSNYRILPTAYHINMNMSSEFVNQEAESSKKRRLFSSLSSPTDHFKEELDVMTDANLSLEEADIKILNVSDNDMLIDEEFVRPLNPTPIAASRNNISVVAFDNGSPTRNSICFTDSITRVNHTKDLLCTPINGTNLSTPQNKRNVIEEGKTCLKDIPMVETPVYAPIQIGSTKTCTKVIPMEETPIVSNEEKVKHQQLHNSSNKLDTAPKNIKPWKFRSKTQADNHGLKRPSFTTRLNKCVSEDNSNKNDSLWYQFSVSLKGFLESPILDEETDSNPLA